MQLITVNIALHKTLIKMVAYNKIFILSGDKEYCRNIWSIVSAFGGFVFVGSADLSNRKKINQDIKKSDTLIFDLSCYDVSQLLKLNLHDNLYVVGVGGNQKDFARYLSHGVDVFQESKKSYAELLDLIKNLSCEKIYYEPSIIKNILNTPKPYKSELTVRELEVLQALSLSQSYSQISNSLYISIDTVKTHLKNIYSKLDVTSRFSAVETARLENII